MRETKPAGPPPPKPSTGLDEVERALSVLKGRHEGYTRAEREMREAAETRKRAIAEERARELRRKILKGVIAGASIAVVSVTVVSIVQRTRRTLAFDGAIDRAAAPFRSFGFANVQVSTIGAPHTLDADIAGNRCVVAVSAAGGEMTVRHGDREIRGESSIGFCACAPAHVTVKAPPSAGPLEGLALVEIDASAIGGTEGWRTVTNARPRVVGDGGDECKEATLLAWLRGGKTKPVLVADAEYLKSSAGAPLARAGFETVVSASPGASFAYVEPRKESCYLAFVPPSARTERAPKLRLAAADGAERTTGPALGWCAKDERPWVVWTGGAGRVVVIAAPSARIGGLLGASEAAARAGVAQLKTWLPDEDAAWDATTTLRASAITDESACSLHEGPPQAARFAAVSLRDPLETEVPGVVCAPGFAQSFVPAVCAQVASHPLPLLRESWSSCASAPLPFWLTVVADQTDATALRAELLLASLARKLHAIGFELTMFSGVSDKGDGRVVVDGRAGADSVVVVGVENTAPWLHPFSNGAPWSITGEPKIVPVAANASVTLTASPAMQAPPKQRRVVVFRGTAPK